MTILVTGTAGFIGFHTSLKLLERGEQVLGIDNINDYYDPAIKHARLKKLEEHTAFSFSKLDIADRDAIDTLFSSNREIRSIIHLAAQAGVRYSLQNPFSYVHSNVSGHLTLLEATRELDQFEHFVYASSSSVYGANKKLPFSIEDRTDTPMSIYAATKKSVELMSYTYSSLYEMPVTGLRYFTAYGPWGRPDMALFIFVRKILAGEPIPIFNNGDMKRNFTYIDDIVSGTIACMDNPPPAESPKARVYNIGNDRSEQLMDFIGEIEKALGKKAEYDFQPLQPGDVPETIADISETVRDFGFSPRTPIQEGIPRFVEWYRSYFGD